MNNFSNQSLSALISDVLSTDLTSIRKFLLSNPEEPLICTGSGGAETAGDFAALLYGARGGVATSVSPYTFNSYSDATLKTSKSLIFSAGGHNNDALFAAKRALSVHPEKAASLCLHGGDRNEVDKHYQKAGSSLSFITPVRKPHDGFVSVGTPLAYYALLARIFDPDCVLLKYSQIPQVSYTLTLNDGSALAPDELKKVRSYIVLQGSWGRPVSLNLEGKLTESGLAPASVYDFRNYCHGRFIYTSQHLDDSAVVMFVSPREHDIAARTRAWLPASTKLIIIETSEDSPLASFDLLVKATSFFLDLCDITGASYDTPKNPGRIDKRKPMWVPFMSEMKKNGPLTIR